MVGGSAVAVEAGGRQNMSEQAVLPGEFIAPRLYVSDVTIERLPSLVQAGPRGIVSVSDELLGCS